MNGKSRSAERSAASTLFYFFEITHTQKLISTLHFILLLYGKVRSKTGNGPSFFPHNPYSIILLSFQVFHSAIGFFGFCLLYLLALSICFPVSYLCINTHQPTRQPHALCLSQLAYAIPCHARRPHSSRHTSSINNTNLRPTYSLPTPGIHAYLIPPRSPFFINS